MKASSTAQLLSLYGNNRYLRHSDKVAIKWSCLIHAVYGSFIHNGLYCPEYIAVLSVQVGSTHTSIDMSI